MTLGEKLVILRKKNSLSQDELASAIRVSRQTVYKWESGQSAPDANNLIALKATFGIMGFDMGVCEYPTLPYDKEQTAGLKDALEKAGYVFEA